MLLKMCVNTFFDAVNLLCNVAHLSELTELVGFACILCLDFVNFIIQDTDLSIKTSGSELQER